MRKELTLAAVFQSRRKKLESLAGHYGKWRLYSIELKMCIDAKCIAFFILLACSVLQVLALKKSTVKNKC